MSAETTALGIIVRTKTGKGIARAIRRTGLTPGIIYGNKEPPVPIALDSRLVNIEISKPGFFTRMLDLRIAEYNVRAICRSVQRHPVSHELLHVDFQRVGADALIHVAVPVRVINETVSPGVKRGGVVNLIEHTIVVVGHPTDIPYILEIDLTGLKIGDSIHLNQVKLPEGVRLLHSEVDLTMVTIVAPSSTTEHIAEAADNNVTSTSSQ